MAETNGEVCENEKKESEKQKFYSDAENYWENIPATLDGMLGGFAKISPTDVNGSRAFLRQFLKVSGGKTECLRALDCGAGIGRITKRLLLPIFDSVDMVELNQKFLDKAKDFIGPDSKRLGHLFCSGLQDFNPDPHGYDVIWCQWVLGHLTDKDLASFLQRCRAGLKPEGIVVIKENVTSSRESDFDTTDSSYTRAHAKLVHIMLQAGMTILKEQKQKGFPKGIYDVYMFALR